MNSNPLVSVVVPIYNMESYLEETLNSVLASSYSPLEIILMDDDSSDDSAVIAQSFAAKYDQVFYYHQSNGGAASARNHAISIAKGTYILPVDADNLIHANYISDAVAVLDSNPSVKVVSCEAEMFGEKNGKMKFPKFSYRLLARKNMIDNCAMYRKVDWEKAGGYCDYILGREDWDFWIAMFKSGGEFYRLPLIGLFYRVRNDSKRRKTQNRKRLLVDAINDRHKPFIFQQLGGPLHYKRSWSRCFNFFSKVYIAEQFNILVKHETVISDVYHLPELFKQNKRDGNDWASLDASTFILSCRNETKKHTEQLFLDNQKQLQLLNVPTVSLLGTYTKRKYGKIIQSLALIKTNEGLVLKSIKEFLDNDNNKEALDAYFLFLRLLERKHIIVLDKEQSIGYYISDENYHFIVVRPQNCIIDQI